MSDTLTRGIRVQVASFYDADRSSPQEGYYFFAYRVRITNVESDTVQLVSREWFITDANGEVQRVQGPGVVGRSRSSPAARASSTPASARSPPRSARCTAPTAWSFRP